MSNDLAVAAATAVLRVLLERALQLRTPPPLAGARVTTRRPDRVTGDAPGVNLFLYALTPNPGWQGSDLPTRNGDGTLLQRPLAALDLHYLVHAYGDDDALDGHRLLARVASALHADPVLRPSFVASVLEDLDDVPPLDYLSGADLADQVELVRVTPRVLSLDEMTKLWSACQAPLAPSLVYTASVVLVEADRRPHVARPVRRRTVTVAPGTSPRLTAVRVEGTAGGTAVLDGTDLAGPSTRVRIGPTTLTPAESTPTRLEVPLADAVPIGVHAVQVRHLEKPPADGDRPRVAAESNALPATVRPHVVLGPVAAGGVELRVSPPVERGQRLEVWLSAIVDATGALGASVAVRPAPATPRASASVSRFTLDLAGVAPGPWWVRVRVDGLESQESVESVDDPGAPVLTVPAP
ncbi:hypothetical protein Acsp06_43740 [Actinomycetospora sp. NBRC 106375]|uniref:DUF4255 domain-containing protein n=1 Tax=Actinomycetospora sp. NBRC 106375 TaxID=3032207 RepID=UPI0024A4F18D|nr:DUF4255 domain-containing protein [Actinomycetospora sp. NBRC 106375]GLZ48189.1 hypothetical protein Acsp06_43740 [Actinomycetospora sp. NBRC 106375]